MCQGCSSPASGPTASCSYRWPGTVRSSKPSLCLLLHAQSQASQTSNKWKEEREAKKEADWDARLKEAYK